MTTADVEQKRKNVFANECHYYYSVDVRMCGVCDASERILNTDSITWLLSTLVLCLDIRGSHRMKFVTLSDWQRFCDRQYDVTCCKHSSKPDISQSHAKITHNFSSIYFIIKFLFNLKFPNNGYLLKRNTHIFNRKIAHRVEF